MVEATGQADVPLSLATLESHLWTAANILRGPVDASDFKTYIFPLLFFKRISDVYDEESRQALDESQNDEQYAGFPENHRFQVPEGAHWRDVRNRSENVGQGLQVALREIERANPKTLSGIFGDANWTNKDRLPDRLMNDLIDHFSLFSFSDEKVPNNTLGQAYEYLVKKFADATNKKAGEFYTPRSVVRLMVTILDPREGETIYDPACGAGGMLLEALNHIRDDGGNVKALRGRLFGQEKNLTTAAIARINLFLHGVEDFRIVRGDTLREPAFFKGDRLATFDCVIANPPFSLENWGEGAWASDRFGRNVAGVPPKSSGDLAWVQHMMTSMAIGTGRMAVVLPHGVLFRAAAEGRIRRRILEMDLVEAVIGLAPNLFYGTGLAASIMVLRQRKPAGREGKLIVIDASRQFRRGRAQNTLEAGHADRILALYEGFRDEPGLAKVATLAEIAANDWNLNITRYVEPVAVKEQVSMPEAVARLRLALDEAWAAEDRLAELLRGAGLMA